MSFTISQRVVNGVHVLDCVGRISIEVGASKLRDSIDELIHNARQHASRQSQGNFLKVLVNFQRVDYLDCAGFGQLISGYTSIANHGGRLRLFGTSPRITKILRHTRLAIIFEDKHSPKTFIDVKDEAVALSCFK